MSKTACVYRFFNSSGALLYVGTTVNPFRRAAEHATTARYADVASISIEWHENKSTANAAEMAAIRSESPAWNEFVKAIKPDIGPKDAKGRGRPSRFKLSAEQHQHICALWYSPAPVDHVLERASEIMEAEVDRNRMNHWCGPRDGSAKAERAEKYSDKKEQG